MRKTIFLLSLTILSGLALLTAQPAAESPSPLVDYDAYLRLLPEVKAHRATHLVHLDSFLLMSREPHTIILDTRSDAMYQSKHVKGALHLNFADFTQANLARIIPSADTRILIYCNNNFEGDQVNFATKDYSPPVRLDGNAITGQGLTLALNIPTYINLFGYGYRNIYELADFVNVSDPAIQFEGSSVITEVIPVPFGSGRPAGSSNDLYRQPSRVDFDAYEKLAAEVQDYRKARMLRLDSFLRLQRQPNVIVLDTRSDSMYRAKHLKGAIHLNFSDFTQANLAKLIPDNTTTILIYCNNNFKNDPVYFASKVAGPVPAARRQKPAKAGPAKGDTAKQENKTGTALSLALNIPTYINLYGYNYKNVYELNELLSVNDPRVQFEGTSRGR